MAEARKRARAIKLFVHDVHGVITPDVVYTDQQGGRRYEFWHMDGFADLSLLQNQVIPIFLDSTSVDKEGLHRAQELKLERYYYRVLPEERLSKLGEIAKEHGASLEEVGFLGYEITDLSIMRKVCFAAATSDAADEVKDVAHYVTSSPGGRGAMRELCEFVLRAKGLWEGWVEKVTKMGYK